MFVIASPAVLGRLSIVFRHQWDDTSYFEKLAAESTEGTTLADLFYCWSCSTCIFPFASFNTVEWRRILGLSCVPSNAGVWALREFKLETREDSAMIEVWKFLVGAAPSTSRVREAGAAKLPGASFNFNARTREVSRRTGSGAALEALALRDPQKG